jgi:hypothetical protein
MLQVLSALMVLVLFQKVDGFFICTRSPYLFNSIPLCRFRYQSTPSYIPDASAKVQRLMDFLIDNEECEGIEATTIGYSNDKCQRRGVFAKESFEQGDYILAIPFVSTILISETNAGEQGLSDIQLGFQFWQQYLQYYNESNVHFQNNFPWKTYFDCLPTRNSPHFTPTAEFWTDDAVEAVEVPMFVDEMKRRKQEVKAISNQHTANTDTNQQKLSDDLLFASWLIRSRGFTTVKASVPNSEDN